MVPDADLNPDLTAWVRQVRAERPPAELDGYLRDFERFFDAYAADVDTWKARHTGYHEAIARVARFYVPRGVRVLEVGCGTGDLLAALEPSEGVGVDLSRAMVSLASARHPGLTFHHMAAERLELLGQTFDYVVLSDLVGYLYDIREVFDRVARVSHPRTRLLIHWYSRLWQPIVHLLERLGLKCPLPYLNWTTIADIRNLLALTGFETLRQRGHILVPVNFGPLGRAVNDVLTHLPVASTFAWTNWTLARPTPRPVTRAPRVSVIAPCRNERENIEPLVRSEERRVGKECRL